MANSNSNVSTGCLDFRVIELSKSSSSLPLREKLNDSIQDSYICLGHFDYIRVSRLDAVNPLSSINTDYQARDNYDYPLYSLHYPDCELVKLENFWNVKSCFMTVSRVHFEPSRNKNTDLIRKALSDLREDVSPPSGSPGEFSAFIKNEWVHSAFYHSLELGDLVIVLKSNSILSCLDAIRRIMEIAEVGDIYSFCGIHSGLVQNDIDKAVEDWDKKDNRLYFQMRASDAIKQIVPRASMRFSVRSIRCAKAFWEYFNCKPFFIAGTADAIIDLSGKQVKDLIAYIFCLIYRTFPVSKSVERFSMYDAFESVITRIGSEYGDPYSGSLPSRRDYPASLQEIQKRLKDASTKIRAKGTRWGSILIAQSNTLVSMMGNCVTDDLSMLIWPSVCALMDRLDYYFANNGPIGKKQESEIGAFLDSWDILENDILRLEGQLSQEPELQSSRYYTSATLLAFYMALLDKYNEFLLEINQEKDNGYIPLITYSVELRAHTRCILDPSSDTVGNGYRGNTPLLVSLPVSMMYRPLETAVVLCHEMSHYVGASTRQRETRYHNILKACAANIAKAWMLDGRDSFPLIQGGDTAVLNEIAKYLNKVYCKRSTEKKRYYIEQLTNKFPDVITQVFYDQRFQSGLMQRYLQVESVQRCVLYYIKIANAATQSKNLYLVRKRNKNLLLLYRECYADMLAILSLKLNIDTYLLCMYYREAQYIKEIIPDDRQAEHLQELQIQSSLVLYALGEIVSQPPAPASAPSGSAEEQWLSNWKVQMAYYHECFSSRYDIPEPDDKNNLAIIPGDYIPLLQYLMECKRMIEEKLKQKALSDSQMELCNILATIKDGLDLQNIHTVIEKYRETFRKH